MTLLHEPSAYKEKNEIGGIIKGIVCCDETVR